MNLRLVSDRLVLAIGTFLDAVLEELRVLNLLSTVDDTLLLGVEPVQERSQKKLRSISYRREKRKKSKAGSELEI